MVNVPLADADEFASPTTVHVLGPILGSPRKRLRNSKNKGKSRCAGGPGEI